MSSAEYISLKRLAEKLDVSPRTLALWAQTGKLPGAIKFGRDWRVRAADVEEWLSEKHASAEQHRIRHQRAFDRWLAPKVASQFQPESESARTLRLEIEEMLERRRERAAKNNARQT